MSFFNKLFGGDKKTPPPAPPKKTKEELAQEKKIKVQAATNQLDLKIQAFEEKEKKFEYKIDLLKEKAKELIAADKKKEAKKYVDEATRVKKQLQSYTLRRKVLLDKRIQLQNSIDDYQTIEVMEGIQVHLQEGQAYAEKLNNIMLDGQEAKMQQKEINDKLKDMVENDSDQEDVDEMFNELMGEVKKDKEKAKQKVEPGKNVNVNVVSKKQVKEEDDIQNMLANL